MIHHSDPGSQYTRVAFAKRCEEMGVKPSRGMHLGMNIMRERAQRLGGEISFENRGREGMSVRLEFPATVYRKVNLS